MTIFHKFMAASLCAVSFFAFSCTKTEELTLEEIEAIIRKNDSELLSKTVSKAWKGGEYQDGKLGGTWKDTILSDPKTFNQVIAERDGESNGIISQTLEYLFDYDTYNRQWTPRACSFEILTDSTKNTLTVRCTVRDGLVWSYYNSDQIIPVTSDDFVFWYNEIAGDPEFGSSGYGQQWVTLENGEDAHIDCVKINDKVFEFQFPRIVADPLLATNMSLCPSFIYKPAKEKGGVEGVKNLFSIADDPSKIPSCGQFYITEYIPARRIVFTRNPHYWNKDKNGVSIPYYEKMILQIVGDKNTDYLLFKQGQTEIYTPRPEEYADVINNQSNDYTVFNADGSMGASMWSFNQNPINKNQPFYKWFTKKEFRQAMSCLLNRERIATQTYRGLAEPTYWFFPISNPYYNSEITLKYRFNVSQAEELLGKAGFVKKDGLWYDWDGNKVEFDLTIPSSNTVLNDIGQIVSDECGKTGIKVNIRQIDFQKVVEMLTGTYDWQSVFIGLGTNNFPSQGSNVWPSGGNLHLWYPMQEVPATDWEARIDYLYNEGCYTIDHDKAKAIWDEYQQLILEQCPIIYLMRPVSFFAIRNKWDLTNVYYDNRHGTDTEHVFLRQ